MNVTDKYVLFWGTIFSNFAYTPYTSPDGKEFFCAEQEFAYRKACLFNDEKTAEMILGATSPKQCKILGRKVINFDEEVWHKVRYDVMYNACKSKFTQNEFAHKELMSYPGKTFVAADPYDEDGIWGIGLAENNPKAFNEETWEGQNLLGKVLTQIRDEFEKVSEIN